MKTYTGKEATALFNHHMGENVRMILEIDQGYEPEFYPKKNNPNWIKLAAFADKMNWNYPHAYFMLREGGWGFDDTWKASLILGHNLFKSLSNEVDALLEEEEARVPIRTLSEAIAKIKGYHEFEAANGHIEISGEVNGHWIRVTRFASSDDWEYTTGSTAYHTGSKEHAIIAIVSIAMEMEAKP